MMKPRVSTWPYLCLLALLLLSALAYFLLSFQKMDNATYPANYPQGYFVKNNEAGKVRIIPWGGTNLKSPLASDPNAVFSPYLNEGENRKPALQNLQTY